MNRARMAGNYVILDCNGIWIVLAYLRRGSVIVREGEPRPGTADAALGGDPLPIRFDGRYLVRNQRLVRTGGSGGA